MSYAQGDFNADAVTVARDLHVTYNRCVMLLARWYNGFNLTTTDPAVTLLMSRVEEMTDDYQANGSAKLNTVLAVSDLKLPGD